MITWTVYKHTSLKSGKSYIGQTSRSMELRWREHCKDAIKGSNKHFHNAIRLYGELNWHHEVLHTEIDTLEEALVLERLYIKQYDTFENGYNSTLGGEGSLLDGTEYTFYNKKLGLKEKCSVTELAVKYDLHPGYVRYVTQGKVLYTCGWFLWEGDGKNYDLSPIYDFEHKEYGCVSATLDEMVAMYNVCKGNICSVAKGKRRNSGGWTLKGMVHLSDKIQVINAKKVLVTDLTNNSKREFSSILETARELQLTEHIVRDRCNGRCSSNKYSNYSFEFKDN